MFDRDLEARKHLWKGLERLSPRGRVAFLNHVCKRASGPLAGPGVTTHSGTAREAWLDIGMCAAVWGLDLQETCAELERWLKRAR